MRERFPQLAALGLLIVVSAGVGPAVAQEPETSEPEPLQSIPDTEIGLAKGSIFDVLVPPVAMLNTADPGDMPLVGRAFVTAPPRVPHAVDDFMPITREENWCVDCHTSDWTSPDEDDPTAIPVSHYVNLRDDTDDIGSTVAGARWVCVSCHMPAIDVPELVANSFSE